MDNYNVVRLNLILRTGSMKTLKSLVNDIVADDIKGDYFYKLKNHEDFVKSLEHLVSQKSILTKSNLLLSDMEYVFLNANNYLYDSYLQYYLIEKMPEIKKAKIMRVGELRKLIEEYNKLHKELHKENFCFHSFNV
ncbi:hypothetical protein [Priestia megaterium]|uniref:hypothetical protein n=1 Tax=Priestia megaterium TaxID=1404 RepID=UPI0027322481|nr:hypothetical protein [Priestia megaterium]MDP1443328.1 hypothetical protein [Priestia megaterium]MDP1472476.1 hypothetical protein [Priestia megaterium]